MVGAGGVFLAALEECAQRRPFVPVLRRGHVQSGDLTVEPFIGLKLASPSLDNARGLVAVVVTIAGQPCIDGYPLSLPRATRLLERLENSPRGPIVAGVPHAESAIVFLKDPRPPRPDAVGVARLAGGQAQPLPYPVHRSLIP